MNLNKAMLIGNLTRDPETRVTPSGQALTTFSVATNLVWTDASGQKQKKAEYHNIVAWRKLGEICAQYLHKGNKVYIEGRIQTRDWTAQDGTKKQRTEIVAENMIMLDTKGAGTSPAPRSASPAAEEPTIITAEEPMSQPPAAPKADDEIRVEDIPF